MKRVTRPEPWLSLGLLVALVGSSAAQARQPPRPADEPPVKLPAILSAKPLKEDPKDDEPRKLLKARYNEALGEAKGYYEECMRGRRNIDEVYESGQRLVQAGLELYGTPAERVALLTQYVEMAKQVEKYIQAAYDDGRLASGTLHRARYERLDAEIKLLRAKREPDKAKDK